MPPTPGMGASLTHPETTTRRHHAARIAAFCLKTQVQALSVQIFTALYKCTKPKPNANPRRRSWGDGGAPPAHRTKIKDVSAGGLSSARGPGPPPVPWGPAPHWQHPPTPCAAAPCTKIPFSEPVSHSGGRRWLKEGGTRLCPPQKVPPHIPSPCRTPGCSQPPRSKAALFLFGELR